MITLEKVRNSIKAVKRIMEIQQSLYIRNDNRQPVDSRKPTLDELQTLFTLIYETTNDLEIVEKNLDNL